MPLQSAAGAGDTPPAPAGRGRAGAVFVERRAAGPPGAGRRSPVGRWGDGSDPAVPALLTKPAAPPAARV